MITGSSRGIGAAIARLFAREGTKVALHGRDAAALATVKNAITREEGTAIVVVADVTKFTEIETTCPWHS